MSLQIERTDRRYQPLSDNPYFTLNQEITHYLDAIKPKLQSKKILDLGAGEVPFSSFYQGLDVTTADVGQNSQNTIQFVFTPNQPLPFGDHTFDVVFLFDVLEHVKDDLLFTQEIYRILKPGGLLLGTVPFMYRFHEAPYDYRRYTVSGLRYLFGERLKMREKDMIPLVSVLETAAAMIREKSFPVHGIRKIIYKVLRTLIRFLTVDSEVCPQAPMTYLFAFEKD